MPNTNLTLPTLGGKQIWGDCFVYQGYRIQRNVFTQHYRLLDPALRRLAWGSFDDCHDAFGQVATALPQRAPHLVVLLHGIFRAAEGWRPMQAALHAAGFSTAAVTYPSTRQGIELHADQVDEVLRHATDVTEVSFVTHSMGGLVAREVLGRTGGWRNRIALNRLVMIATPNKGAHIADQLVRLKPFRELAGVAATQLTSDYVPSFAAPPCPFAVVAGSRGNGRGYNPLLPGEDDMTVTVESALLEGAEDQMVVPGAVHTFIHQTPAVVQATVEYLQTGRLGQAPG